MIGHSSQTLEITGDAGLRNAQEIATQLRQALADHSTITVVIDAVTSIDISIIQLLVAARKSALAAGKSVILSAPADGPLRRLLTQAGLVAADGQSKTPEGDFWTTL